MSGHVLSRLLLAALFVPLLAAADPRYTVTVVGGAGSFATDLNNQGQVVGYREVDGARRAFLYSGNTYTDLGTLGGASSWASRINNSGQISGTSEWGSGAGTVGFFYSAGVMNAIAGSETANAINDSGMVAGTTWITEPDGDMNVQGYSWSAGSMTLLGTLPYGDFSIAYGINNGGQVVGAAANAIDGAPNRPTTSFLYADGMMTDLGNLGGVWSGALSVNDRGQVVGYSGMESIGGDLYPTRAFLYSDGVLHNLGSLVDGFWSSAQDINALGQVVGWGNTPGGSAGFLYMDGVMTDLNTLIDPASGWVVQDAWGINDLQQIAGTACKGGECYAVRLDLALAVPEPHTWTMLLAGGLLLGLARRRQGNVQR
jgi:probable HAF family extracellular repeat protein